VAADNLTSHSGTAYPFPLSSTSPTVPPPYDSDSNPIPVAAPPHPTSTSNHKKTPKRILLRQERGGAKAMGVKTRLYPQSLHQELRAQARKRSVGYQRPERANGCEGRISCQTAAWLNRCRYKGRSGNDSVGRARRESPIPCQHRPRNGTPAGTLASPRHPRSFTPAESTPAVFSLHALGYISEHNFAPLGSSILADINSLGEEDRSAVSLQCTDSRESCIHHRFFVFRATIPGFVQLLCQKICSRVVFSCNRTWFS